VFEASIVNPGLPALLPSGYAGLNTGDDDDVSRLDKPFG
jgi:hypothetical protein